MKFLRYQQAYVAAGAFLLFAGCDSNPSPAPTDGSTDSRDTDGDTDTLENWDTELPELDSVFADASDDEAAELFGPDKVAEIHLTLPPDVWEQLVADAVDEVYVPADVAINGEDLGEIALRFKGSYGTLFNCFVDGELICDKLSMKIKFNEYDDTKRFKGLKRINLHAHETSDQRFLSEYFGYKLYRAMGIPAPRSGFANVWVNDTLLGVYSLVEQIDGRFTDSRFVEGNGNLFKETQFDADDETVIASLRTNIDAPDISGFKAFAAALSEAADEDLPRTLAGFMNLTYLMRYMAVDDVIYNTDGITAIYCGEDWGCINHNFYIYQEEATQRFWLLPWDLDATFDTYDWLDMPDWKDPTADCDQWYERETAGAMVRPPCGNLLVKALGLQVPRSSQYLDALVLLRDEAFDKTACLDEAGLIGETLQASVDADPDRSGIMWSSEVRKFQGKIEDAYKRIDRLIDLLTE